MNIDEIRLLTTANSSTEMVMLTTQPFYITMVEAAACHILLNCHPHSREFIGYGEVEFNINNKVLEEQANLITRLSCNGHTVRGLSAQTLYLQLHNSLSLIQTYVEHRNKWGKENWMVGEEGRTLQLAYSAVLVFHAWKVGRIEDGIKKNGTEFGSGTGWFTTSYKELVEDWPSKYEYVKKMDIKVPVLPCLREDWQDRRRAYKDAERAKVVAQFPEAKFVIDRHGNRNRVWSYNPEEETFNVYPAELEFDAMVHSTKSLKFDQVYRVETN